MQDIAEVEEFAQLNELIGAKKEEGILTTEDERELLDIFSRTTNAAGDNIDLSDPASLAVVRQMMYEMKQFLLRIHPELTDEL